MKNALKMYKRIKSDVLKSDVSEPGEPLDQNYKLGILIATI